MEISHSQMCLSNQYNCTADQLQDLIEEVRCQVVTKDKRSIICKNFGNQQVYINCLHMKDSLAWVMHQKFVWSEAG